MDIEQALAEADMDSKALPQFKNAAPTFIKCNGVRELAKVVRALRQQLKSCEAALTEANAVKANMGECVKHHAHRGIAFQCLKCAEEIYKLRKELAEEKAKREAAEGDCCEVCGAWVGEGHSFPQTCPDCARASHKPAPSREGEYGQIR